MKRKYFCSTQTFPMAQNNIQLNNYTSTLPITITILGIMGKDKKKGILLRSTSKKTQELLNKTISITTIE